MGVSSINPVIKVIGTTNGLATASQQRFVRRPTTVYYRSAAQRSRDQPISVLLVRHDIEYDVSFMGGKFEHAVTGGTCTCWLAANEVEAGLSCLLFLLEPSCLISASPAGPQPFYVTHYHA